MTLEYFEHFVNIKTDMLSSILYSKDPKGDEFYPLLASICAIGLDANVAVKKEAHLTAMTAGDKLLKFGLRLRKRWLKDSTLETASNIIRNTLVAKGKQYALGKDRLSNFKRQALPLYKFPIQALIGNVAKHLACVDEFIDMNVTPSKELAEELTKDIMCYGVLLTALAIDETKIENMGDENE